MYRAEGTPLRPAADGRHTAAGHAPGALGRRSLTVARASLTGPG